MFRDRQAQSRRPTRTGVIESKQARGAQLPYMKLPPQIDWKQADVATVRKEWLR
jgi:hypothetical protein